MRFCAAQACGRRRERRAVSLVVVRRNFVAFLALLIIVGVSCSIGWNKDVGIIERLLCERSLAFLHSWDTVQETVTTMCQ